MSYIIKSIDELKELINNREYVDNLTIDFNKDINHLLRNLTDLTYLKFGEDYDQITDLSTLSNLQHLVFGFSYNKKTDLSALSNLQYLKFGYFYNHQCRNLNTM